MAKLNLCKCGKKPKMKIEQQIGLNSGDMGYLTIIECPNCKIKVKSWALLKSWSIVSCRNKWNESTKLL